MALDIPCMIFWAHTFWSLFMSTGEQLSPLPIQSKTWIPRLKIPIDSIRVAIWLPENDPHWNIEIATCELRRNEQEKRMILWYQHELPTRGDTIMLHYFWLWKYWVHSAYQNLSSTTLKLETKSVSWSLAVSNFARKICGDRHCGNWKMTRSLAQNNRLNVPPVHVAAKVLIYVLDRVWCSLLHVQLGYYINISCYLEYLLSQ